MDVCMYYASISLCGWHQCLEIYTWYITDTCPQETIVHNLCTVIMYPSFLIWSVCQRITCDKHIHACIYQESRESIAIAPLYFHSKFLQQDACTISLSLCIAWDSLTIVPIALFKWRSQNVPYNITMTIIATCLPLHFWEQLKQLTCTWICMYM